jgi:hypothetical protein
MLVTVFENTSDTLPQIVAPTTNKEVIYIDTFTKPTTNLSIA